MNAVRIIALAALSVLGLEAAELSPGVPAEIFVAPGRATTVLLHTARKISAVSLASPVVTYKYDKALNQLELTPAVRTGGVETNLNLRIGPSVYVLLVKVVDDARVQYLCEFTLAGEREAGDEEALEQAHPLKPGDIDIVGAARAIERAGSDPVFRRSASGLRIEPLNNWVLWNDCAIALTDVAQFADADLLVFRVQWVNRTRDALYLDISQYRLLVGERPVPVTARYKIGTGPVVYPGQRETVYLAVQGYRLSRRNDWRLGLPPDAAALQIP
jgi:hypothetical protein